MRRHSRSRSDRSRSVGPADKTRHWLQTAASEPTTTELAARAGAISRVSDLCRKLGADKAALARWHIAARLTWHADCCSAGMAKAPGYQKNPQHRIQTTPVEQTVRVFVRDQLVAESNDVLRVDEDGHPPRYYFPLLAVHTDLLERTQTQTRCPFKGTASYFTLRVAGSPLTDAIWSYEDPYEEHQILKGRLAFYTEKFPEISIRLG